MKKRLICLMMTLIIVVSCFTLIANANESNYMITSEGILPFKDIKDGTWYYDAMLFCYANEIIKGQGNEYTFAPSVELTRATFAVMLARVLGADLEGYKYKGTFTDCKEGSWYTPSVEWVREMGYVMGTGDGTAFSPNAIISREQCATMLYRVIDKMGIDVSVPEGVLDTYIDKNAISSWALNGACLMVHKGIMKGGVKKDFMPKKAITRAEIVVVTENVLKTIVNGDCKHEYTEADCTSGKTCNKCGLVFSLPNGHYCETLSCKEGSVCITCGEEVAADPALHKYSAGNCTTPEKCSVCGDVRKAAAGHKFTSATCTAPMSCSICNVTVGTPLGHTTKFGICTRCNCEVFASKFLRCAYYMVEKAEPNGKGQYMMSTYYDYDNNDYDIGVLYYDATKTEFTFIYSYFWEDGTHSSIAIYLQDNSNYFDYEFGVFDANEKELSSVSGSFNASQIRNDSAYYKEKARSGSSKYWRWLGNNTEEMIRSCVYYNDFLLDILCGEGVESFGFIALNL